MGCPYCTSLLWKVDRVLHNWHQTALNHPVDMAAIEENFANEKKKVAGPQNAF